MTKENMMEINKEYVFGTKKISLTFSPSDGTLETYITKAEGKSESDRIVGETTQLMRLAGAEAQRLANELEREVAVNFFTSREKLINWADSEKPLDAFGADWDRKPSRIIEGVKYISYAKLFRPRK